MMGQTYDIKYADTTETVYDTKQVHAIGWAYAAETHNPIMITWLFCCCCCCCCVKETSKLDKVTKRKSRIKMESTEVWNNKKEEMISNKQNTINIYTTE